MYKEQARTATSHVLASLHKINGNKMSPTFES